MGAFKKLTTAIRICNLLIVLLIIAVGCVHETSNVERLKNEFYNKSHNGESIIFQPNPMYEYNVAVNVDLIEVLHFDSWEKSDPNYANHTMMIYCDVLGDHMNCRVAFFSNGDILIQDYSDGQLEKGKEQWYHCVGQEEGALFENLVAYIDYCCVAL